MNTDLTRRRRKFAALRLLALSSFSLMGLPVFAGCSTETRPSFIQGELFHIMYEGKCASKEDAIDACEEIAARHGYTEGNWCGPTFNPAYGFYSVNGGNFENQRGVKVLPFHFAQYEYPTSPTDEPIDEQRNHSVCPVGGPAGTNPVHPALGRKVQVEVDAVVDGWALMRTYSSSGGVSSGAFGFGWGNEIAERVQTLLPSRSTNVSERRAVITHRGDRVVCGRVDGAWAPIRPIADVALFDRGLSGGEAGLALVEQGQPIRVYDSQGRLIRREGDSRIVFRYGASGRVESIQLGSGRSVNFTYGFADEPQAANDPERRWAVTAVELPDGQFVRYEYEYVSLSGGRRTFSRSMPPIMVNRLVRVVYPDGKSRNYHYDAPAVVQDSGVANQPFIVNRPYLLTGITDERGQRFATWAYDDASRATLSVHGGSGDATDRVTLDYVEPHKKTRITDELGNARDFEFTVINGEAKLTRLSGPSAQCGNRYGALAYDTAGNLQTATDFNNRQHTFAHDDRGRRTRYTESVGTPQQRTTETDWHALYSVPLEERVKNAAGTVVQRTVYTHDALGNVLTVTVSDPVAGTSRTLTATRDPEGRLLTIDGPRTDVSDITTYT
ncbi:MAG: DUF6531 domain-containing protein [Lysobacteraceae bacterium]